MIINYGVPHSPALYDQTVTAGTPLDIETLLKAQSFYLDGTAYRVVIQNSPVGSSNVRVTERSTETPDATHGVWLPPGAMAGYVNARGGIKVAAVAGTALVNVLFY